jgi:hypothetical protein
MTSRKINQETLQLFLNSKTANKYLGGFTSNCVFNLPLIVLPRNAKIHLSLQSASIPFSFYNVDYFNNKLVYSVNDGSNITIEIPQGNYSTTSLRNYLLTAMTGFLITYSSLNNTFTFTHPTYNFQFKSSSTCMEILGFDENDNYPSSANVLTSINSINLFTIRNIYITSNNLSLNNINNSTPNLCNILASIPLTSGANSVITYSNMNNIKTAVNDIKNFTLLQLALTDQDGDILDLNGCHWSMTLQIDYAY